MFPCLDIITTYTHRFRVWPKIISKNGIFRRNVQFRLRIGIILSVSVTVIFFHAHPIHRMPKILARKIIFFGQKCVRNAFFSWNSPYMLILLFMDNYIIILFRLNSVKSKLLNTFCHQQIPCLHSPTSRPKFHISIPPAHLNRT